MYNYDDNGALSITHFAPDTVTTACGVYILDGRAAWTQDPRLVEGCPPCMQAAQNGNQVDNGPPFLLLPRHRRRLRLLQPGLCQSQARNGRKSAGRRHRRRIDHRPIPPHPGPGQVPRRITELRR